MTILKHLFGTLLCGAFMLNSALSQEVRYKLETGASSITWHAEKVTGAHDGTIDFESGDVLMKNGKLSGGRFVVDMNSIRVTDIRDHEYNQKLRKHLKSDDFFASEQFPQSFIVCSNVIYEGKERYKVQGKLTIKGITKDIRFTAFLKEIDGVVTGSAELTVDRAEYEVKYGSGTFFDDLGDRTIYDEFTLKVSIVAK